MAIVFNLKFIFLFTLLAIIAPNSFSANSSASKSSDVIETKITSDFINLKRKSETIDFINNVVVEKEDTSFLADRMIAHYYENKKNKPKNKPDNKPIAQDSKSIKKIDATGNVRIFNQEFIATGDFGFYDPKKGTFTIEKNVVFNNGTSIAKGEKFIYNTINKKGYLVGKKSKKDLFNKSDERVVVVIGSNPKEDNKDTKKQTTKSNKK
jgi:lipopolysaccharide export system protein LptA